MDLALMCPLFIVTTSPGLPLFYLGFFQAPANSPQNYL